MQKHIISRLAVFGRLGFASTTAIPRVAVNQQPFVRAAPMAMFHTSPARFEQSTAQLIAAQKERDAAAAAVRQARKQEIEQLSEEERMAMFEARQVRRKNHIREIEATVTETWVPLEYAVEKYRRSALSGPNYRGAGIQWFLRNRWALSAFQAKHKSEDDKRRVVSKERVDVANFRVLRMSRDLEVDLDEEWDGDLEANFDWKTESQ
jgi:Ni/Co efflux regulator RcnB